MILSSVGLLIYPVSAGKISVESQTYSVSAREMPINSNRVPAKTISVDSQRYDISAGMTTNNQLSRDDLPASSDFRSHTNIGNKFFLIAVPGLSFHEMNEDMLQHMPHLRKLATTGAIGAMNIRTPSKGIEDSYLTIGAGGYATSKVGWGGWVSNHAQVVVPEIVAIKQMNRTSSYRAHPGLLGDVLQKSGIATAWFGNRDRGFAGSRDQQQPLFHREAALMMMNSKGIIRFGDSSRSIEEITTLSHSNQFLIRDSSRPFGIKTDYDHMLQLLTTLPSPAVVLLELGDFDRLYAKDSLYPPEHFDALKLTVLEEIDACIGQLLVQMTEGDRLMLFAPQVHKQAESDKLLLAPVIMYGTDVTQGVLSSATTRRSGIVAQFDILPTIVDAFNLQRPEGAIGFPFTIQPKSEQLGWLASEVNEKAHVYRLRPKLLYAFVTYQVIVLLIGLLIALLGRMKRTWWIGAALHSVLLAPVVLLLLNNNIWGEEGVVVVFFMVIVGGGLLLHYWRLDYALLLVSAGTVLLLLIDGFRGSVWMQQSVLGYDPMIGARYYGMGNEYMGVLIGATVLSVSLVAHFQLARFSNAVKVGGCLLFLLIIIYFAAPSLGTNAGGAIAATVTFVMAGLRMFGGQMWQHVKWGQLFILVSVGVILACAGLWLMNTGVNIEGGQSHIGRALQRVFAGDFKAVSAIIHRKIAMNWHLIGASSWSKVLLTSLFVIAVMLLRPKGYIAERQQNMPLIFYGFSANAVGAIVALLVNDSGIVAAATLIVYVTVPLLLYRIRDGVAVPVESLKKV